MSEPAVTDDVAERDDEPKFDKEAEPLGLTGEAQNEHEAELRELLWSLEQIAKAKDDLDHRRTTLQNAAYPLFKVIGRPVMILNPITGKPEVAAPRYDEMLVVPADQLLAALVEHFIAEGMSKNDAEIEAEMIWADVLKPPAVDTKEGGLFKKAVDAGRIPGHVVAKVAKFKPKEPWVGFTQPKQQ